MPLTAKVEPIDRDVLLHLGADLSPAGRSRALAEFAGEQIEDAEQTNRTILGRLPRRRVFVDGREGAPLESVKADGVIVAEFELQEDVLVWIAEQLETHSPVRTGRFRKSNTLFADGVETIPGQRLPNASEFVFINLTPYARKIERGSSSQAPDGVFQAVAALARGRFGNIAKITFAYRTAIAGRFVGGTVGNRSELRNPAVIVRFGDR